QKAADLFVVELEVAWVDAEGHNGPARFHRPDGTIQVAVAAGVDSVLAHEFHRRTRTRCFKGYPKPVRTELQHVSVLESPRLLQADAIDLDPAAAVQVEKPPGAADTRQEGVLGRGLTIGKQVIAMVLLTQEDLPLGARAKNDLVHLAEQAQGWDP